MTDEAINQYLRQCLGPLIKTETFDPLHNEEHFGAFLDAMVGDGWSYSIDAVPWFSSAQRGTRSMFIRGLHSPVHLMRFPEDHLARKRLDTWPCEYNTDRKRSSCMAAVHAWKKYLFEKKLLEDTEDARLHHDLIDCIGTEA